jgi:hypothetical protein
MGRRREGEPSPYWKRIEIVMKVQLGQMSARQAAQELGVDRRHYYRLEEEMLRAALLAVTPGKPGPKPKILDPKEAAYQKQLKELMRERELLEIKVRHMEEIQREMVARFGEQGGKKDARRARPRKPRSPVSRNVQAARPEVRRGTAGERRLHPGVGPADGARPLDPLRVEKEQPGAEAGPERSGS